MAYVTHCYKDYMIIVKHFFPSGFFCVFIWISILQWNIHVLIKINKSRLGIHLCIVVKCWPDTPEVVCLSPPCVNMFYILIKSGHLRESFDHWWVNGLILILKGGDLRHQWILLTLTLFFLLVLSCAVFLCLFCHFYNMFHLQITLLSYYD